MELFRAEKIATVRDQSNHECRFCAGRLTLLKTIMESESESSFIYLNACSAEIALGPPKAGSSVALVRLKVRFALLHPV
jgi:hypothetical protein